ncbi:conserved hypothetical protein [Candidatus Propionivibrio aalborgensis]|uniref:DUF3465 domain-containing protein n=1 Tax=Candidatus Propionivibrio aalborgensis TaxID=1860101 RepID=A0A1A8Y286_9RHOO|nr:DUF3465 domain-containing protein [Candidatus Propionivibrio aalborgensis]MBK9028966.1 DUF3465 domain-containing protein [Propionivibrio sp.]SBT11107.1 conserved hypothetical protein [Candidatus Propionivibrio aalborgensis]
MRRLLLAAAVLFAGYAYFDDPHSAARDLVSNPASSPRADKSDAILENAFARHESNVQVSGRGVVVKLLPDDNSGSKHQKFIVKLLSGQTVLIAHNIDIAPRVIGLGVGDSIQFNGEYEWNARGGVVHWTHRDPSGLHPPGWLNHRGKTYQ